MGQIQILQEELSTDPEGVGYATMSDKEVADSLNAETRSKAIGRVTGTEIGNCVDENEYRALPDADKTAVRELVQKDEHNPFGFTAVVIKDVFPQGGPTIASLVALRTTATSRAKELGAREFVQEIHVTKARTS